jgi:TatD DNase family protein
MIDSHCHLDAKEFESDLSEVLQRAYDQGVRKIINPSVDVNSMAATRRLSHASKALFDVKKSPLIYYCLGIHPMWVQQAKPGDLDLLKLALKQSINDPLLAGVGEIGLDGFVPGLDQAQQQTYFENQLKLALEFDLPVVMHVRRAQDSVLKNLRQYKPRSGIAHAFNGSMQQAQMFIQRNCALGFGGAMTFTRALQIRRLAQSLPLETMVLETDSPDISPSWRHPARNEPGEIAQIAQTLAILRETPVDKIVSQTGLNVVTALNIKS